MWTSFCRSGISKSSTSRKVVPKAEQISGTNLIGINHKQGEVKEVQLVPMRDGWDSFETGYGLGGSLTD